MKYPAKIFTEKYHMSVECERGDMLSATEKEDVVVQYVVFSW